MNNPFENKNVFYQKFKSENRLTYYNSTTMMLTLSMFQQLRAKANGGSDVS